MNLLDECAFNISSTGGRKNLTLFHVKSNWNPPVQPSVALETFLEEVRFALATINIEKPKDNLSHGERCALKELSRDENIILKKAEPQPPPPGGAQPS